MKEINDYSYLLMKRAVFQVASDLHLEFVSSARQLTASYFEKFLPKKKNANYLILAGDICTLGNSDGQERYQSLMNYCSTQWEKTFIVAGNHEYYGTSKDAGNDTLRRLCNAENIVLLNQSRYEMPEHNLVILGATLWSATSKPVAMNDYNQIYVNEAADMDTITHYDTLVWHHDDRDWFTKEIAAHRASDATKQLMCITHHLPSYTLVAPRWQGNPINAGFASNLDHLVHDADYWICGHTHIYTETTIGKCRVLINPRGYPGENPHRTCTISIGGGT